ncbi:unnamed protein product [Adineta steineri]|uniref:Endonuclease/exonuclease/phosphatase domain-containing protein n=1 Tax=Adineta steineri TaxID=433720 RepID=A0A818ISH6_9BILA|nr:unnamed protein product [Adineta steineri]
MIALSGNTLITDASVDIICSAMFENRAFHQIHICNCGLSTAGKERLQVAAQQTSFILYVISQQVIKQLLPKNSVNLSSISDKATSTLKKSFKLISWNIDAFDTRNPKIFNERINGVVNVIKQEKPDAIFFQEVIPTLLDILKTHLCDYDFYAGNLKNYFVTIFTRRDVFQIQNHSVLSYPWTTMNKNLLTVNGIYRNSIEIDLMTSHLESCDSAVKERIQQLKFCFQKMMNAPKNRIVLFDGDLNLHDHELQQAGNIPAGIYDLWVEMGKKEEYTYTWDMQTNTNLNSSFPRNGFLPRHRFDRLYFRPATTSKIDFKPISFKLQGREMIQPIQRFCSDHWAIQVEFQL